MKNFKKIVKGLLPCLIGLSLLSGCNEKESIFTIMYYPGGYGAEWIKEYAKNAVAQERGISPDEVRINVDFKLVAEEEPSSDRILKSSSRCPDVIFANSISADQVSAGLIEPIDDVYDTEVATSKGNKKISDYLIGDVKEQFCMKKYVNGKRKPYAIPFTNIPISIAYNETMLKSTPHVDTQYTCNPNLFEGGYWAKTPETVDELLSYFNDLTAKDPSIIHLGCGLKDGSNWFEPLYAMWWAQAQGTTSANMYPSEGTYYDFWNFGSAEIYKQSGIQKAFETVQKLFVNTSNHTYKNFHPNASTYSIKDIQPEFAAGSESKVAMCLTGDFFEHEYAHILKNNDDVFKLMRIPSIEGAEQINDGGVSRTKKLTFVNTSNCLFIPSGAKHKELAKKFLVYSSQETQVVNFLKETGGIRSFDFDKTLLNGIEFTDFQQSTIDLYFDRDELLLKFPKNVENKNDINPIYYYENLGAALFKEIDYASLINAIKNYTPQQICIDGIKAADDSWIFRPLYDRAVERFDNWATSYNI